MEGFRTFLDRFVKKPNIERSQLEPPSMDMVLLDMGFSEKEITQENGFWFVADKEGQKIHIEHHPPKAGEFLEFFRLESLKPRTEADSKPKPLAVLIHGMGLDAWSMFPLAFALAQEGIPAVAVSLPGHGLSQGPRPKDLPEAVKPVVGLVESLQSESKASRLIMIGHSLGTYAALRAADELTSKGYPVGFVSLAGPYIEPNLKQSAAAAARMTKLFKLSPPAIAENFFNRKGGFLPWEDGIIASIAEHVLDQYAGYNWLKHPPENLKYMTQAARYSPKHTLMGIIVAAGADKVIPRKETLSAGELFLFPNQKDEDNRYVIEDAPHMIPASTKYAGQIAGIITKALTK